MSKQFVRLMHFFKKLYIRGGIKLKLVGFAVATIVLTVLSLSIIIINLLMVNSLEKKSFEVVTGSLKHIGYFSRHALLERSYENKLNLSEIIKKIESSNIDGIIDISIYERVKKGSTKKYLYLAGFQNNTNPSELTDQQLIATLNNAKSEDIIRQEVVIPSQNGDIEAFRFVMPIIYSYKDQTIPLGAIILNYDKNAIYGVIEKMIDISAIITLIIVLLTTLVVSYAGSLFTKPIITITDAAEEVANGNLDIEDLTVVSNDEIGVLTQRFNSMISGLRDRQHTKDSITYSSLIQHSLVPEEKLFTQMFTEHFAIWQPKDIVGGDIYLFDSLRNENECLIMVIDCTGHGVPGAFVTMLVKAIERQVVANIMSDENADVSPAEILSYFNKTIKHLLKQDNKESISNVGFDGGIMYFNKSKNILKFAGAETPLFYLDENHELKTIKGNRHSIGYKKSDANFVFKEHTIELKKGMQFYVTTDGYLDQNGGEKDFPFGKKRFKEFIMNKKNLSFEDQKTALINTLSEYQGDQERNDDVTVVGIKI